MIGADSKEFLLHCASTFGWNDLSEKKVLDIGCGEGSNSTYRLVELYPNVGKVIAVDKDPYSLVFAMYVNKHPKVEYHAGDIECWPTLTKWEGQMDVVVSHYCFNSFRDKRKAFENTYRLLMPGGTAAIIFTTSANFYDWGKEMGEMYSEYAAGIRLEPPLSHKQNYKAADYQDELREVGFTVIECEDVFENVPFQSDEECREYLTSMCPIQGKLPKAELKSFQDNALQVFLKYSPRNEEGLTSVKHRAAKLLVRKSLGKE